jgi:ribosomal protein S18 acetylase RimI-like enzyme
MAFERLEWESAASPLPYYMGDWKDAERTEDLPPGIYVIKGCHQVSPQYLIERGWQHLMGMVELEFGWLDEKDTSAYVWTERLRPCHIAPLVNAAATTFGQARPQNRLYRTLPRQVADGLMTSWAANSLTDRCDRAGVVVRCSGAAGFVTVRRVSEEVEQIDLLGVRPEHRGKGWGKALAAWAIETMQAPCLRVRTELDNIAALKIYQSVGFEVTETETLFWTKVEKEEYECRHYSE